MGTDLAKGENIITIKKGGVMKRILVILFLVALLPVGMAAAAPVQWSVGDGGNDHYYERIDADVSWDQARTQANAMWYNKMQGYLVTITSAGENLFLTNNPQLGDGVTNNRLHSHWTGGYQPVGSAEPDGGWSWVTSEAFAYNNWASPGEPNNFGNENRIGFDHGFTTDGKQWNDLPVYENGPWVLGGYVVEYGGFTDTANIPAVPEPATMLLVGLGLMGFAGMRKKLGR